jgi:hypothetical protein
MVHREQLTNAGRLVGIRGVVRWSRYVAERILLLIPIVANIKHPPFFGDRCLPLMADLAPKD